MNLDQSKYTTSKIQPQMRYHCNEKITGCLEKIGKILVLDINLGALITFAC